MIEEIEFKGWKRNLRMTSGGREIIITLDVGPRILRYAFEGGDNVFKEYPDQLGKSGEDEWVIRGGHRFWTAPEGQHSYLLDNSAVGYVETGLRSIEITSPPADGYDFQKKLRVAMDEDGGVDIEHELINTGKEPLKICPWALSVMRPGGVAIIPQNLLGVHPCELPEDAEIQPQDYLPDRNLVLWNYTNLQDERYQLGPDLWRVRHQENKPATKIGLCYRGEWVGYQLVGQVFCKSVPFEKRTPYPDGGSNFELFADNDMMELETLAPAKPVAVDGSVIHKESWRLRSWHDPIDTHEKARQFFDSIA